MPVRVGKNGFCGEEAVHLGTQVPVFAAITGVFISLSDKVYGKK